MTERLVSIVAPLKDEAGNIGPLVEEIVAAMAGRAFEIVLVDDGSTDATPAEIAEARRRHPMVRHLRREVSCGQSAAVRAGVRAARGEIVATLDGDGQNDPAFLPLLIDALVEGLPQAGLAAGQRTGRTDGGFKALQSRIANGVRSAVLKDSTRDTGCGLKAFPRELYLALPYFDGLHRFLPALTAREGRTVRHVDVTDRPRGAGRSKYGMWDRLWIGLADLAGVWWLIRRARKAPAALEVTPDAR